MTGIARIRLLGSEGRRVIAQPGDPGANALPPGRAIGQGITLLIKALETEAIALPRDLRADARALGRITQAVGEPGARPIGALRRLLDGEAGQRGGRGHLPVPMAQDRGIHPDEIADPGEGQPLPAGLIDRLAAGLLGPGHGRLGTLQIPLDPEQPGRYFLGGAHAGNAIAEARQMYPSRR